MSAVLSPRQGSVRPDSVGPQRQPGDRHTVAFAHSLNAVKANLVPGNRVDLLINGPAAYDAMFAAIEQAKDHINIESYIVEHEGPGAVLADLLKAKCEAGVRVNLIYDSFGSWQTPKNYFEQLALVGVRLCEFNPLLPWRNWFNPLLWRFNLRDHRKLLIVDGRIAFTGGINISSVYSSGLIHRHRIAVAPTEEESKQLPWRDTHVRVEGPVVADFQRLFLSHWRVQLGRDAQAANYWIRPPVVGDQVCAAVGCDAGCRGNPFYRALLAAIEAAQSRIFITVGYFVPTRRLVRALAAAAKRGVDVRLLLPGQSDVPLTMHATRSSYGRLLASGVQIFEHRAALLHAKTAVIDGFWCSIGSHNMDWRSVIHNAEANIVVLNDKLGRQMEDLFEQDTSASDAVLFPQWIQRGRLARFKEWAALRFEYFL